MIKSHQHVANDLSPISTLLLAAAASEAASNGTNSPNSSNFHSSPRSSVIQKSPFGVSSSSGQQSVIRSQVTNTSNHVHQIETDNCYPGSIISRHPYLASQLNSGPSGSSSSLFHTFKHGSQSWRDPNSSTVGHGSSSDRQSGQQSGHESLTSREIEQRKSLTSREIEQRKSLTSREIEQRKSLTSREIEQRRAKEKLNRLEQLTIQVPKESTPVCAAPSSEPLLTTCTSPFNGQGFGSKGSPYFRRSLSTSSSPLTSQVEVQIIDDERRVETKSASPSGSGSSPSGSGSSPSGSGSSPSGSSSCRNGGRRTSEQDTNQVEETVANPIDVLVDTLGSKARQKSVRGRGFKCTICQEQMDDSVSFTILLKPDANDSTYPFFPCFKRSNTRSPNGDSADFSRNRSPNNDQVCDSVCIFCHHSLVHQWINYELSSHPSFINPYTRNYDVNEYICFVCGSPCTRSQVRTLVLTDFPFLLQHPRPAG